MKNPVITDEQTLEDVIRCPEKYLPMHTQGDCDQRTVSEILIRAADNGGFC